MVRSLFRMMGKVARALEFRVDGEVAGPNSESGPVQFYASHDEIPRPRCRMIAGPAIDNPVNGLAIPPSPRRTEVRADGALGETALPVWAVPLDGSNDQAFGNVRPPEVDDAFMDWKGPDPVMVQRARESAVDRVLG